MTSHKDTCSYRFISAKYFGTSSLINEEYYKLIIFLFLKVIERENTQHGLKELLEQTKRVFHCAL